MNDEEHESRIDFRELSRAGAGLMTLLLAVLIAQSIVLSATGTLPDGEPIPLEELQSKPGVLFGMVITTGAVTGAMAFAFAGTLMLHLLARGSAIGVRAYVFGPLAAITAGQTVGFLTAALESLPSETGSVLSEGVAEAGGGTFFLAAMAIAVVAPLGEEFFFRGFLLESMNRSVGRGLALLFSATLFGLIHFDPIQSFSATAIGLVLGILAMGSRSLWPAIFAHAVNNAFFLYLVRYVPPEVAAPETQLSTVANGFGVLVCLALTYGFLLLAVGKARLGDLFEGEPLPDY